MSAERGVGSIVGTITRRLLVNSWVDPDEVSPILPAGLRPHVGTNGGVVAGCCMIEIAHARPWPTPRFVGVPLRAAAHRISVEVGPVGQPTLAVFVPVRHTDSRPAILAGGRVFPGVHVPARIGIARDDQVLSWDVSEAAESVHRFGITATASLHGEAAVNSEVANIVIGTTLGLSPGRQVAQLEAVEMFPARSVAQLVELKVLESAFLSSFHSAVEAETLLMTDVDVTWKRSQLPA